MFQVRVLVGEPNEASLDSSDASFACTTESTIVAPGQSEENPNVSDLFRNYIGLSLIHI